MNKRDKIIGKILKDRFDDHLHFATRGVIPDAESLADCYRDGLGCKKDIKKAMFWYNRMLKNLKNIDLKKCSPESKTVILKRIKSVSKEIKELKSEV